MGEKQKKAKKEQESGPGAPAGDDGALEEVREEGQGFLDAAMGAVDKALSGNSEQFLKANRQSGGQ